MSKSLRYLGSAITLYFLLWGILLHQWGLVLMSIILGGIFMSHLVTITIKWFSDIIQDRDWDKNIEKPGKDWFI